MVRCVVCGRRKGKRRCPLKRALICSRCCGAYREEWEDCPEECPYMSSETRREVREEDQVPQWEVRYLALRKSLFPDVVQLTTAVVFEMHTYLWCSEEGETPPTDAELSATYDRVRRRLGGLFVAGDERDALAEFLLEEVEEGLFPGDTERPAGRRVLQEVLSRLSELAAERAENRPAWGGYWEELETIFLSLRDDMRKRMGRGRARRSSLILPAGESESDEQEDTGGRKFVSEEGGLWV